MKLLEDVIKKKKFYQILSIVLLSLDIVCYLTLESLDIGFTADNERDYNYLAFGVVLFCYLLIDELKALSNVQEARPKNYYIYNISTIIILLNIFTAFFRIIGGIMIFVYITILKIVKKREEYEREERIMALNNNRNIYNQNMILNSQGKLGVPSNLDVQSLLVNNNNRSKLLFWNNGFKSKNNSLRKHTNLVIDEDDTAINDRLISDDRAKNVLYNRARNRSFSGDTSNYYYGRDIETPK